MPAWATVATRWLGLRVGTGGGGSTCRPQCPTSHPKELGLISVGSLLWVHFESTHQGLTHVSGPVLGAVGTIRGVWCLFQEIRFMSTAWVRAGVKSCGRAGEVS